MEAARCSIRTKLTHRPAATLAGRSVFVTGHTGFKGAWLSLWLARAGARVTGYSLAPPTIPSLFQVARVREAIETHHQADIRDRRSLAEAIGLADPDVLFHLAAQTRVLEGYRDPIDTVSTNIVGTATVLDALRERARPCAVVVISSDKCYENDDLGRPFVENDRLGGSDPYSGSKGAMELVVSALRRSYFRPEEWNRHRIGIATARAGNVIGGGDWTAEALIPDTVRALNSGRPVELRRPRAIRPWQHVLEPLSGYLLLAHHLLGSEAPEVCGPWNFGPDDSEEASTADVVEAFIGAWGSGTRVDNGLGGPSEAGILRLSSERSRAGLGWRPRWQLAEAVRRTAAWYRKYMDDPSSARQACDQDIADYERQSLP